MLHKEAMNDGDTGVKVENDKVEELSDNSVIIFKTQQRGSSPKQKKQQQTNKQS